jgi:tRNA threonylcarbamoyladenosine biosynthesis protein TsaE
MLDKGCEKIVESPEAMVALGETVGRSLQLGDFLALRGGLGAGKTHFTKGVVAGLGCKEMVTSPTFTLAHEYIGGRLSVFHFDFYRMETEDELLRIGWDEYLDENGIVVVEWANKFPDFIPDHAIWLEFEVKGETRVVRFK